MAGNIVTNMKQYLSDNCGNDIILGNRKEHRNSWQIYKNDILALIMMAMMVSREQKDYVGDDDDEYGLVMDKANNM